MCYGKVQNLWGTLTGKISLRKNVLAPLILQEKKSSPVIYFREKKLWSHPSPIKGTSFARSRFTCGAHLARSIDKNIIRIFSHFSLYCRLYGNNFYMTSHEPALVSPTDWVIACAQTKITKQAILQIFRCDTCSDSYMVLFIIIKTEHH